MKKRLICFVIVPVICFSSCSNKIDNTSSIIKSSVQENYVSLINDVVQNSKEFICSENGQNIYFKDFHSGNYLYIDDEGKYEYTNDVEKYEYTYDKFCIIDLDEDGYLELLLEESQYGNIVLFHYESGTVYGFVFPYRGLENIKKDTSFESSGGADLVEVEKVKFSKDKAILSELCFCDELDKTYRINGKNVSQEETDEYLKNQNQKENVEWYSYNESNLREHFIF